MDADIMQNIGYCMKRVKSFKMNLIKSASS